MKGHAQFINFRDESKTSTNYYQKTLELPTQTRSSFQNQSTVSPSSSKAKQNRLSSVRFNFDDDSVINESSHDLSKPRLMKYEDNQYMKKVQEDVLNNVNDLLIK